MAIPALLVEPGDEGYDDLYSAWVAANRPKQIINAAEGSVYRGYTPDGGSEMPVFALECSTPELSVALATRLQSWGPRGSLPIESV